MVILWASTWREWEGKPPFLTGRNLYQTILWVTKGWQSGLGDYFLAFLPFQWIDWLNRRQSLGFYFESSAASSQSLPTSCRLFRRLTGCCCGSLWTTRDSPERQLTDIRLHLCSFKQKYLFCCTRLTEAAQQNEDHPCWELTSTIKLK